MTFWLFCRVFTAILIHLSDSLVVIESNFIVVLLITLYNFQVLVPTNSGILQVANMSLIVVVYRQQEKIAKDREEVERQRKLLGKRKPPVATAATSKQPKATKDGDVFLKPADKPSVLSRIIFTLPLFHHQL